MTFLEIMEEKVEDINILGDGIFIFQKKIHWNLSTEKVRDTFDSQYLIYLEEVKEPFLSPSRYSHCFKYLYYHNVVENVCHSIKFGFNDKNEFKDISIVCWNGRITVGKLEFDWCENYEDVKRKSEYLNILISDVGIKAFRVDKYHSIIAQSPNNEKYWNEKDGGVEYFYASSPT
jgi:hypothetical protein